MKISPSLLAADFAHLAESIAKIENGGADMLHLDVMDGTFVPNISFGPCVISAIRPLSRLFFDVHLMVKDPERYINDYVAAGADGITVHIESTKKLDECLDAIRAAGKKAAISVSPKTPIETVFPYLQKIDMVLIMTVEPGFGGQKFMPDMMEKARTLRKKINELGLSVDIEADGGIGAGNTAEVLASGINVIVAGSAIFGADDPAAVMTAMRKIESAL